MPGIGGPDFFCMPKSGPSFSVEVAHIDTVAVEERTGLKNEITNAVQSFSGIQQNLWAKTNSKVRQLQGTYFANVLAICVSHAYSSILVDKSAAEWFMAGVPAICLNIGSDAEPSQVTDLHGAAFLELKDGVVHSVREEISAILLLALSDERISAVGMLHPCAQVPFDIHQLPEIPYLRLEWPVQNSQVRHEWVQCKVRAAEFWHQTVSLTDSELTGGQSG